MAFENSLLDVSEHPERSAEGFLPHGVDSSFFELLAAVLFLVSMYFLLVENNPSLFALFFLGFLFAFHPAHAPFRSRQRMKPI
ncbi:hypothetical protein HY994_02225 [Candidatus Micrarchaeota archaeon]|nr:hypothetical protein [Candidatus Micrarchaeota archaeon]